MKTTTKILLLFLFVTNLAHSQCDSFGSISVSASGFESSSGYTQEYVLVNSLSDIIVDLNGTGSFTSVASGDYYIYAVNYKDTRPSELTIGNFWSDVSAYDSNSSNCFESLSAFGGTTYTVCNQGCINDQLNVSSSGYYSGGSYAQTYVLLASPSNGNILASNLTGEFLATDFAGDGVYEIYAINTELTGVLTAISVGSSWSSALALISANCAELIGPLYYDLTSVNCTANPLSNINLNLIGGRNFDSNELEWTFEEDVEIDHFNVFKSDGTHPFVKIAETTSSNYFDYDIETIDYYKVELITKSNEEGLFSNSVLLERSVELNEIVLYPNPAKESLTLSFNSIKTKVEIEIVNSIGQIMYSTDYESSLGENKVNIDISYLSKQVYFVRLKMKEESMVKRFVKI